MRHSHGEEVDKATVEIIAYVLKALFDRKPGESVEESLKRHGFKKSAKEKKKNK